MKKIILPDEIDGKVKSLAEKINKDYSGREIDLVCISNGATIFLADLARLITVPTRIHMIAFTAYSNSPQSGEVRITLDVTEPLQDRHVIVLEGIVISGRTPLYIMKLLAQRRPASIEICAIGMKPDQLLVDLKIRYCLFNFDKEWVTGYGIGNGSEKGSASILDLGGE